MSLVLTDQEIVKVDKKSRQEAELPTYYSSNLQTNVKISRDFEAYLILSSDDLKTAAIEWIKTVVTLQKVNKERDDLVALATAQERSNAQAQIKGIDNKLKNFNNFRSKFKTTTTFAEVPEVQYLLFDLQRVVEELIAARERCQFDDTAGQVTVRNTDHLVVTQPQIEQLQSWTGVLSEYLKS